MIDINQGAVLPVTFFIAITTLKMIMKYVVAGELLKFRKKTINSEITVKKYRIALYKSVYYIISLIFGFVVLHNETWIRKLDFTPLESIPLKFKAYYIFTISFYVNELITIGFEPAKSDLLQMVLHHISTILLMYLSYSIKYIKFGVLIIPLHDISDPILEFCKVCNYLNDEICANVGLFVFTTVFTISRLLIYPRYFLLNAYNFVKNENFPREGCAILFLLFALQIMHLIWTVYIVMLFVRIINGGKAKDVREISNKKD